MPYYFFNHVLTSWLETLTAFSFSFFVVILSGTDLNRAPWCRQPDKNVVIYLFSQGKWLIVNSETGGKGQMHINTSLPSLELRRDARSRWGVNFNIWLAGRLKGAPASKSISLLHVWWWCAGFCNWRLSKEAHSCTSSKPVFYWCRSLLTWGTVCAADTTCRSVLCSCARITLG